MKESLDEATPLPPWDSVSLTCAGPDRGSTAFAAEVPASLDPIFEKFMREQHVPGLVYGVVAGQAGPRASFGVRDVAAETPVTPDTAFRIASMTKQFTALATLRLRDAGRISLDAPAEKYIPEMRKRRTPPATARRSRCGTCCHMRRVRHRRSLGRPAARHERGGLHAIRRHRRALLARAGIAYEYSNFGFALAGRLVTNVSGTNYSDYIADNFLRPLGMPHTVWDIGSVPASQRARGIAGRTTPGLKSRRWAREFGAMGGLITTANDYARYVTWLLSALPPRDDAEDGLLRRSSVREIARPVTTPRWSHSPNPRDALAAHRTDTG